MKKLNITHHLQGWGMWFRHKGLIHFWEKDVWKSVCGHKKLDEIEDRWKMKYFPKNDNNFPERKKCESCLNGINRKGIIEG